MNAVFSLLNQLSQTAWDRVTGAEQPKLYVNPKGQIQETVGALTQLQETTDQHRGYPTRMPIFYILM